MAFNLRFPHTNPPLSPRLTMPTMYDLPSEDPEEPGLPDEFHDLQPQLLSRTLRLADYAADRIFTGTDLNLYYDSRNPLWHKRPDWFLVVDVPRLYDGKDLRSSYVVWQEGVHPFVVVELLSPGTQEEDLGDYAKDRARTAELGVPDLPESEPPPETAVLADPSIEPADWEDLKIPGSEPRTTANGQKKPTPPPKWVVYEQILRVPYYVVFSRYTNRLRFFRLVGGKYQEQALDPVRPIAWIPELKAGLASWEGVFGGSLRFWLRWVDEQGNWVPTDTEAALTALDQERAVREAALTALDQERAVREAAIAALDQERQILKQTVQNLVRSGMAIAQIAQITGLSETQIQELAAE